METVLDLPLPPGWSAVVFEDPDWRAQLSAQLAAPSFARPMPDLLAGTARALAQAEQIAAGGGWGLLLCPGVFAATGSLNPTIIGTVLVSARESAGDDRVSAQLFRDGWRRDDLPARAPAAGLPGELGAGATVHTRKSPIAGPIPITLIERIIHIPHGAAEVLVTFTAALVGADGQSDDLIKAIDRDISLFLAGLFL